MQCYHADNLLLQCDQYCFCRGISCVYIFTMLYDNEIDNISRDSPSFCFLQSSYTRCLKILYFAMVKYCILVPNLNLNYQVVLQSTKTKHRKTEPVTNVIRIVIIPIVNYLLFLLDFIMDIDARQHSFSFWQSFHICIMQSIIAIRSWRCTD